MDWTGGSQLAVDELNENAVNELTDEAAKVETIWLELDTPDDRTLENET